MLLALPYVIDRSDGAFLHELPDALVLRREAQFLGIHQLPVASPAGRNHLVGLFEREAQRLLDDDVLADVYRIDRDARVQVVRDADIDDFAVCVVHRRLEIREPARDPVPLGEPARVIFASGIDGHQLGVRYETEIRLGVNLGNEPGADQDDFRSGHCLWSRGAKTAALSRRVRDRRVAGLPCDSPAPV
jgi:hypothetical protein